MLSLVAVSTLLLGANALTPNNVMRRSDGALSALKYTSVGATGSYNQVTNMYGGTWPDCGVNPYCIQSEKSVSGPLSPFDEGLTIAFRGPLNIHNIAVYQPANISAATWPQVSSWSPGSAANNLIFMNNMGGQSSAEGTSGNWTSCQGSSQSFANSTWTGAAGVPTSSSTGYLPETMAINIMTGKQCTDSNPCEGYSWGTAYHGWAESKFFVMTFDMPASEDATNVPAIWALNAQVVHATQYGCNCRGEGSPGGCGELDILEVLTGDEPDQAISEVYSFKGATGSGASFFPRPMSGQVTYGVVFDVQSDSILIQQLTEWDYTQTAVTRSIIEGYLAMSSNAATTSADTLSVSFSSNARRADRRSIFGAHRRHHH